MLKRFKIFTFISFLALFIASCNSACYANTKVPAKDISVNTSGFSKNLSSDDTDVQHCLATLDQMAGGGGGSMTWPSGSGIAVYSGSSSWGTSLTDNHSHWDSAYGWGNWASNFGTTTGTIAQGNDSRIANGQTAYGWGNHASAGYVTGTPWTLAGYLTSVTAHNLLSTTHGDTLADSVVRGDILIGNSTPKWARLAFPASPTGKVLQATATDIGWSSSALGTAAFTASTAYDASGAAAAVTPTSLGLVIGTNTQAHGAKLDSIQALASAAGWLHNDGAGAFAYSTPSYSDVGALAVGGTAANSSALESHAASYFQTALTYPVTGIASPSSGYLVMWGASGNTLDNGLKMGTMTDAKWCSYTTANGFQCTENAPAGAGDMVLASSQSVTGLKTFDNNTIAMKGTSTGVNTLSVENTSATSYTNTLPAKDGTFAMTVDLPTKASLSVDDLITLSGVADGAVDLGTFTGSTIADNQTIKAGLQALETAVEGKQASGSYLTAEVDPIVAAQTNGFTITRGTTPATLTVASSASVSGTNTGDNAPNSSSTYIGTTAVALNRGSGALSLSGVNIDGTAANLSGTPTLPTGTTLVAPVLGTPASGTLTSCTGLPVAGITASTSTALGVGSIELGHATDTTIARVSAGVASVEGQTIDTASNTLTLTNKRVTPRILSATSYTTDTGTSLNCDNLDQFIVTAQAGALKLNNPTGTPVDGQRLLVAITGTAARALTYDTQFEASTVALPTTTVTTARLNMLFIWRADTSKWVCVAAA